MTMPHRLILHTLTTAILLLFLSNCEFSSTPNEPLRIAAHVWPGYEFMFLARQENWLDKQQVKLVETNSATASLQALKDGLVDGAALTLDEVLRARNMKIPLTVVLVFDISAGADMLLAKPDIEHLSNLKGKRIGVEQGALGAVILSQALQAGGLTPNDIKQVALTIDNHKSAWQADKVDALITYEPIAGQLLSTGARRLYDSRQAPNMIIDVLAVRQNVLSSHQDAIEHLIASHFQALQHFQSNTPDASYRMATHLNVVPEKVTSNYKGLLLPNTKYNHLLIGGENPQLLHSTQLLSAIMLKSNILSQPAPSLNLFTSDFLPRTTL
mgnify:FL=1